MNDTPVSIPFQSIFDTAPEKFAEISVLPRELPTRASGAAITLQDPSTLQLAVIGVGTIAVYWLATRFLRPPRPTTLPMDRSGAKRAKELPARPKKRGAA